MKILRYLSPLLLLLLLSGCGQHSETLSPLSGDAVILALGDSLTYGSGARREQSYPAILSQLSGLEVINAGIPGEVSRDGLARLPELLDHYRPQLLLLCHGGNDMLRRHGAEQMAENLQAMVELAQARGIPVVLLGVPRPAIFGLKSADEYYTVARATGSPLEDRIIPRVLADKDLKSDQIHPNAEGYRQMAEAVHALLKKTGAMN